MGEPLSPDRVFDFPVDEPEPYPAYDFFAPGPLPGYAGNPNNNNGWIEADVPLLGELGVVADEPMVGPIVDELAEPIVEAEEQAIAPVVDMDEEIAMLFGDDDFEDDDSEGFDEEEVWDKNEEWLMAPVTPPPMPAVPPPSIYEVGGPSTAAAEGQSFPLRAPGLPVPPSVIEDLNTRLGNLEYGHGQLVKKVIQVSDAEVAADITIREICLRVFAIEGQVQVMESQMVHAADRFEQISIQAAMQHRDTQIQQLQTIVSEMSSRESTLMQCILGMDRRIADLERRPPGPQLVPSCCVIFDLEPLSLSFDFHEHVVMNSAGMRHLHLHLYMNPEIKQLAIKRVDEYGFVIRPDLIQRISLTGFPAQSVGSSNTDVLDLPCLLVLITGTSQSRQHGKSESDSYYLSD
ncbi:hypothetical protein Tco_0020020 [Tanacetum coccineum]